MKEKEIVINARKYRILVEIGPTMALVTKDMKGNNIGFIYHSETGVMEPWF